MNRNTTLDYLKFFAIAGVVLIHTTPFIENEIGLALNSLARFAVPFFFIISGYLFTKKFNGDLTRYGKQIIKLTKLYLSWYFIYVAYDLIVMISNNTDKSILENIYQYSYDNLSVINLIYYGTGTSGFQLWYLPALILATIILFVFLSVNRVKYLLIGSLILHIFGVIGESYTIILDTWFQTREVIFFSLFYTTLGAFIAKNENVVYFSFKAKYYLVLGLSFSVLQILERYILITKLEGTLSSDFVFTTIFASLFLFLFALKSPNIGSESLLTKIGGNAVGIFVIHVLVMEIGDMFIEFINLEAVKDTIIWDLLYTPIILFISYYLYQLIQVLKKPVINLKP